MKKEVLTGLGICLMILVGFIWFVYIVQTPEKQARNVVNQYLDSIKTGKGDPYDAIDLTETKQIFINVLDYKYLTTLRKENVRNDPLIYDDKDYSEHWFDDDATLSIDELDGIAHALATLKPRAFRGWEEGKAMFRLPGGETLALEAENLNKFRESFKKIFEGCKTYEGYLDIMEESWEGRAKRVGNKIIVESDNFHWEFEFLYDVVVTNRLGQKLYKKYIFEVEPYILGGYKIVRLHERI